ncbi:RNA polymerase sigma factor [Chitinophaga sp. 22620]|uniref:RNA polymerase sigma factor n=1 Tax=Chitinophaga sp. 22620 TaxID=3453952 RepID=UPI003F8705D9
MPHIGYRRKEAEFNALYLTTRDGLFRFLSRYTKDVPLIEDIMQQCYMKIWERMDTLKNLSEAGPLVRTFARNLMVDVIRRRMKEDTVWLEQLHAEATEHISSPAIDEAGKKQLLNLDAAIDHLPDATRTVFLLHREKGLSYKEIAAMMSISVSMVEKHMSKAIRILKREVLTDISQVLVLVAGAELLKL